MQIGTIDSVWRYPVKGMRGEEVPHIYTAYTGLMGDRIYAVVAADGDPGHPWHTGRNQEEFVLYKASYDSSEELLLPKNLDATYSEWEPGIDPLYPDGNEFKVNVETPEGMTYDDIEDPAFIADLEKLTGRSLRIYTTRKITGTRQFSERSSISCCSCCSSSLSGLLGSQRKNKPHTAAEPMRNQ